MAVVGEVSAVVGLLKVVLETVLLINEAIEDCKGAPDLTQTLVQKIGNTGTSLGIIHETVEGNPERDWSNLNSVLATLAQLLEVATQQVLKYSQRNVEREKAAFKALEKLKATFKLGASKQKKVTEAMLKQIESCSSELGIIIAADTHKKVHEGPGKERPTWGQQLHTKLHEKAQLSDGNTRLDDIHVKLVGKDGKLIELETYVDESNGSEVPLHRGRESGMRVPNSSEIKFEMYENDGWFFYVVTCELREKIVKLFFPTFPALHKNGFHREWNPRTFPNQQLSGATKHDPRGLKMERSMGTPPDGDSPHAIFIIITSKQVLPKGDISNTLLKIEDIAEVLDEIDTEVLVKEFLIDIMMETNAAHECPDTALDNPSSRPVAALDNPSSGPVAALSPSNEQASRNGILRSFSSFLHPSLPVAVIMLLVALLCLRLPWHGFW